MHGTGLIFSRWLIIGTLIIVRLEMFILAIQRHGEHGPYTEMRFFDDLYDAYVQLNVLWDQGYRQIKLIQS